jgi:hypothetical protein
MREALEWYADEGRYQWYSSHTLEPYHREIAVDNGQRAREALREEDTATDA